MDERLSSNSPSFVPGESQVEFAGFRTKAIVRRTSTASISDELAGASSAAWPVTGRDPSGQYAPLPESAAGIVSARIRKSPKMDMFSM